MKSVVARSIISILRRTPRFPVSFVLVSLSLSAGMSACRFSGSPIAEEETPVSDRALAATTDSSPSPTASPSDSPSPESSATETETPAPTTSTSPPTPEVSASESPASASPSPSVSPSASPSPSTPPAPDLTSVAPTTGFTNGGTELTLTGTGFRSGDTITVGGTTCGTVVVDSDTQMRCVLPALGSTGTKTVIVTDDSSQSDQMLNAITYYNPATQFALSGPSAVVAGNCTTGLTVSVKDSGNTATVASTAINVNLSGGSGTFYSASNCTGAITNIGITQYTGNSDTFYYKQAGAGSETLSAAITGGSLTTGTLSLTVNATLVNPTLASISPTSGPAAGGTAVTLTGTGFQAGAAVTVGGNTCTVPSVVSATEITCNIPAGTGTASVVVTNSDTGTVTLSNALTYVPAPAAPTAWAMTSPASGATTTDTTPAITGNAAEENAIVSIYGTTDCSGSVLGTGTVTGGAFTVGAFTLSGTGTKLFYYKIANAYSTRACADTGLTYSLDLTAPTAPSSFAMTSPSSGSISSDTSPAITGAASEDTAIVSIYTSADCSTAAVATGTVASGAFTIGAFTLTGDGAKSFSYKIADTLGNSTSCATTGLSYTLDTTGPTSPTIAINATAAKTSFRATTLTLSAAETVSTPMEMCIGETADCSSCSWEAYATSKAFTLSTGAATKTVSVKYRDAVSNESTCATDSIDLIALSVASRYSAGSNWNDYVRTADTTTACDGTESGSSPCIHGGEARRVVTGETSCTGISMADSEGVFDWSCSVVSSYATFDASFKSGKGLRNLVDAAAWKNNLVTLTRTSDSATAASTSAAWWTNTVAAASDNSDLATHSVVSLATSSTIYTVAASRNTAGYNINADKVALVTLPGATLTWNLTEANNCAISSGETAATYRCVVSAGAQKFIWVEGDYHAGTSGTAAEKAQFVLQLYNVDFSRVHGFSAANAVTNNLILVSTSTGTKISSITLSSSTGENLRLGSGSTYNIVDGATISGGTYGIYFDNSDYGTLSNLKVSDGTSGGILLDNASDNNSLSSATITGTTAGFGLGSYGTSVNNTYRNISSSGNSGKGAYFIQTSNFAKLYDVRFANNGSDGLDLGSCTDMTVSGATLTNNGLNGLASTGIRPILSNITAFGNAGDGINVQGSSGVFNRITSVNNLTDGFQFHSGDYSIFQSFLAANNGGAGLYFYNSTYSNTIYNLASAHNVRGVNQATNGGTYNKYDGAILVGNNTTENCGVNIASNTGLADGTCAVQNYSVGFATLVSTTLSLASALEGKVSSDTTNKETDNLATDGVAAYASVADFLNFDNTYRGWGLDGSAFTNADHRGRCTASTGDCRVWDMSLNSGDTGSFPVLNRSGDGSTANDAYSSGGNCPSESFGSETVTSSGYCSSTTYGDEANCVANAGTWTTGVTFLKNAVEILGDSTGDDDGLCESSESCLYTPNIGAYQGHGTLETCANWSQNGGSISGVIMYAYPTNGR